MSANAKRWAYWTIVGFLMAGGIETFSFLISSHRLVGGEK